MKSKIFVTSPLLPNLDNLAHRMEDIWERKWITNSGFYHQELERKLAEYLDVPYVSLMANGTLALLAALCTCLEKNPLGNNGGGYEVITTPYTFCATAHAIVWSGATPVFCDIDPRTGNIDSTKIESLITKNTKAIMPVHVYGNPCDTTAIQKIADKYNLKVIYDAAHAFGVKKDGKSILLQGDLSCLSFHATKTYNTIEGGAVICKTKEAKEIIDRIRDFGIQDENTILEAGINCKMDEIRAAYGIENLKKIDDAIKKRKKIAQLYRKMLKNKDGIRLFEEDPCVTYNYSYFPIFIDENRFPVSRDDVYDILKSNDILTRKYFFPLVSNLPVYRNIPSAKMELLPNANTMSKQVLCLPIHHELSESDAERISLLILNASIENRTNR